MATRMQQRRGTAAQWVSSNAGDGPILNAGEIGWESDTNKFKIGDGVSYWDDLTYFVDATDVVAAALGAYLQDSDVGAISGVAGLDASKNLVVPGASIIIEGATADAYETTLTVVDPTAARTITFPNATGTVAILDATQTLTNKSISLGSNTVTSTLAQLNTAVSDADVASLAGVETLTNKTLTSPTIATVLNGAATITMPATTGTVALTSDISAATGGSVSETGTQTLTNKTLTSPVLTTPTLGVATGTSLTLSGDLTVNGTTTTINSTTLVIDDKNITLGDVATPSDVTADGGGITLKGGTDKTFNWVDATDAWTSSEHINLASGKTLKYDGTDLVASQTGNSGKYLTTDGTTTSWGTVSGYSAPTLGNVSIASGSTTTTITGLVKINTTSTVYTNGSGFEVDRDIMLLMDAF